MHVPKEDDETMLKEMSLLTEFFRIFPPLRPNGSKGEDDEDDEDGEEAEEEADDACISPRGGGGSVRSAGSSAKKRAKRYTPASLEEILFTSFVDDKKNTMRLMQPLQMRARPSSDDAHEKYLPPLGFGSSSNKPASIPRKKSSKPSAAPVVAKQQEASVNRLFSGLSATQSPILAMSSARSAATYTSSANTSSGAGAATTVSTTNVTDKTKGEKQMSMLKQQQFMFSL